MHFTRGSQSMLGGVLFLKKKHRTPWEASSSCEKEVAEADLRSICRLHTRYFIPEATILKWMPLQAEHQRVGKGFLKVDIIGLYL